MSPFSLISLEMEHFLLSTAPGRFMLDIENPGGLSSFWVQSFPVDLAYWCSLCDSPAFSGDILSVFQLAQDSTIQVRPDICGFIADVTRAVAVHQFTRHFPYIC